MSLQKRVPITEKEFASLLVQSVSNDPEKRRNARKAIDDLTDDEIHGDNALEWDELRQFARQVIEGDRLAPEMTTDEFVNRLATLVLASIDENQRKIQKQIDYIEQASQDLIAKQNDNPKKPVTLLKESFQSSKELFCTNPIDFFAQMYYQMLFSASATRLTTQTKTLHLLLLNGGAYFLLNDVFPYMGKGAVEFFDDLLELARNDACFHKNHSMRCGQIARHSHEAIAKLISLLDDPNLNLARLAVRALGTCGSEALRHVPSLADTFRTRTRSDFQKLYGQQPVPMEQPHERNLLLESFGNHLIALASMDRSVQSADFLTELLDYPLPDTPLDGPRSHIPNDADWELQYSPKQIVQGVIIEALGFFAAFPERFVSRLTTLLFEYDEYYCDYMSYERLAASLAAYACASSNDKPLWWDQGSFSLSEFEGLFLNRHDPIFAELIRRLIETLENCSDPCSTGNDILLELLGRFGSAARAALVTLEKIKKKFTKRYGKDYFDFDSPEDEPVLIAAIRRITEDR